MGCHTNSLYYADYLQLEKLLAAQIPKSAEVGQPVHDEMLFITVHQTYELWFKQQLYELDSVIGLMRAERLEDDKQFVIVQRLNRIATIQALLNRQIDVLETMLPEDFLEFRDLLVPASGFQSLQFRLLECRLAGREALVASGGPEKGRLSAADAALLAGAQGQPSLQQTVNDWLARLPLLQTEEFDFWAFYSDAVRNMLDQDEQIICANSTLNQEEREYQLAELAKVKIGFSALLDPRRFDEQTRKGVFQFERKALLAALFINLYRNEPLFNLPYQILQALVTLDELFTQWRYRHALMVQRMLGARIGTGGSSGHRYLKQSAEKKRLFQDLCNLPTFLIKRSTLPPLPAALRKRMGFALGAI